MMDQKTQNSDVDTAIKPENTIDGQKTTEEPVVEKPSDKQSDEVPTKQEEINKQFNQQSLQEFLNTIEQKTKSFSESLSHLTGSLRSNLHAICGMSLQYMKVYEKSIDATCKEVDESILLADTFVKKVFEVNDTLAQMRNLYSDIKELKKIIEILDRVAE